jgi:outer membrane immunogenic protein
MMSIGHRLGALVGAILALAAAATGANAGDRGEASSEAPTPVWSGLYIGAALGYSFGGSEISGLSTQGIPDASVDLTGQQGVVTVGYDFRVAPGWIAGVFADYALGSTELPQLVQIAINNQWAIGGRVGTLLAPSTLLYASAGFTGAQFEAAVEGIAPIADASLNGYFIGIGGEQAISRNLSLKIDYRFSDYEDVTTDSLGVPGTFSDNSVHSLRLGLSWRFR